MPSVVIPTPWKISHSSTGGIQNPHSISPFAKGGDKEGVYER